MSKVLKVSLSEEELKKRLRFPENYTILKIAETFIQFGSEPVIRRFEFLVKVEDYKKDDA